MTGLRRQEGFYQGVTGDKITESIRQEKKNVSYIFFLVKRLDTVYIYIYGHNTVYARTHLR